MNNNTTLNHNNETDIYDRGADKGQGAFFRSDEYNEQYSEDNHGNAGRPVGEELGATLSNMLPNVTEEDS